MIVVDTNLLVYLFVKGQRTNQAERVLKRDPQWAAQLLWRSEFRNILLGLIRRAELVFDEAIDIIQEAEAMLAESEYSVVSHEVLHLAHQSGCSAYDCEFVSLANDLGVSLVTADRQVLRAFPKLAQSPETFLT